MTVINAKEIYLCMDGKIQWNNKNVLVRWCYMVWFTTLRKWH